MIKIATVCGMGLGTSMMLAMQIRAFLADEGIEAKVDPVDLGSVKTMPTDVIVTVSGMARQVAGTGAAVVLIDNLVDKQEVRTKVLEALRGLGAAGTTPGDEA